MVLLLLWKHVFLLLQMRKYNFIFNVFLEVRSNKQDFILVSHSQEDEDESISETEEKQRLRE